MKEGKSDQKKTEDSGYGENDVDLDGREKSENEREIETDDPSRGGLLGSPEFTVSGDAGFFISRRSDFAAKFDDETVGETGSEEPEEALWRKVERGLPVAGGGVKIDNGHDEHMRPEIGNGACFEPIAAKELDAHESEVEPGDD